jgi:hypothetical protein
VPAPDYVQGVEGSGIEILTEVLSCFSTEFSTAMLKNKLTKKLGPDLPPRIDL